MRTRQLTVNRNYRVWVSYKKSLKMAASMRSKERDNDVYIEQLDNVDAHMEKRVLRKMDIQLLPILGALYTIALIDRTNISVARISGLDDDLDLKVGDRASVVLLVSIFKPIIPTL